jgi:hypothetical protein
MHLIERAGVVLLMWAASRTPPVVAQQPVCDSGLEERAKGPHGYRRRGDRCEGIYGQEVGGDPLVFASLTESFEDYAPSVDGDPPLTIEWTPSNGGPVNLRAQGIKRDLYYQMDVGRPSTPTRYQWPSDVLAARHIPRRDLGVVGWTRRAIGGIDRDVYLPLRIGQRNAPTRSGTYELTLFPTATLTEVYLTVVQVDDSGHVKRTIRNGKPLGYDEYPAQRPIRITLSDLGPTGIYQFEIGALLESGSSVTLKKLFYHGIEPIPH